MICSVVPVLPFSFLKPSISFKNQNRNQFLSLKTTLILRGKYKSGFTESFRAGNNEDYEEISTKMKSLGTLKIVRKVLKSSLDWQK